MDTYLILCVADGMFFEKARNLLRSLFMAARKNLLGTIYHNTERVTYRFRHGRSGPQRVFKKKSEALALGNYSRRDLVRRIRVQHRCEGLLCELLGDFDCDIGDVLVGHALCVEEW